MKIQKHIEIVRSAVPELSSMGPKTCKSIYEVLKHTYETVGITIVNNEEDLQGLVAKQPDLVFVGMKFVPADKSMSVWDSPKIWVTEYLDAHDIAYTGSGHIAMSLEENKSLAKQRVLFAGLPTAPFTVIQKHSDDRAHITELTYPLFVKPTNRGGGKGIDSDSLVHDLNALQSKVNSLSEGLNTDSLVEEYLPGREFSVAVLQDEFTEGGYLLMPLELIAPVSSNGVRILSKEVKNADTEKFKSVPEGKLKESVTSLAVSTFNALNGQDFGRIDIRLDVNGVPHFLEANLIPSLQEGYGNFPKACMLNAGIDFKSMILRIVRLGLRRSADDIVHLPAPTLLPV